MADNTGHCNVITLVGRVDILKKRITKAFCYSTEGLAGPSRAASGSSLLPRLRQVYDWLALVRHHNRQFIRYQTRDARAACLGDILEIGSSAARPLRVFTAES